MVSCTYRGRDWAVRKNSRLIMEFEELIEWRRPNLKITDLLEQKNRQGRFDIIRKIKNLLDY